MSDPSAVLTVPRAAPAGTLQRIRWQAVALVGTMAVVFYLVLGPLAIALLATFRKKGTLPFEPGPFTLENYAEVFLDPSTWALILNTLVFAGGSLILGMSLALILGWLVERSDMPYHELMFSLIIAPMAIPGMMAAIAWIFLLHPKIGLFNIVVRWALGLDTPDGPLNIYTLWGMIFVEGIRMVPTIFLMTSGAFRSMDPALEEASRVAGKSSLVTTFRITLPLMWPAILAALLYFLIVAMEVFEIPGVLGMNAGIHVFSVVISTSVWNMWEQGKESTASALSVILILVLIGVNWFGRMALGRMRSF